MLKIRNAQMKAFEREQLEVQLTAHLLECFPPHCEALGPARTREAVRYGIERARTYGFEAASDLCQYLDLMFLFGQGFEDSPELAWAGEILKDRSPKSPGDRMRRLFEAAVRHLRQLDEAAGE
jgi:hypothetical protein